MSTATASRAAARRRRVTAGVREGGQFATEARAEADVTLSAGADTNPFTARYDTLDEKIAAFHAELESQVASLDSDENWLAYLDTASRFHHYSLFNQLLIAVQSPNATRVAGYRKWQEFGRQVRAGERGIGILAPKVVNIRLEDSNGKPVLGEDGKQKKVRKVVGFTTATVFDIAQTDGDPLPEIDSTIHDEPPEGFRYDLESAVTARGYTVVYEPIPGSAQGYTDAISKRVVIDADLADADQVGTLAHELGHIAAGHCEQDQRAEYHTGHRGQRGRMEVEAESIGYALLRSAGMRPPKYASGAYVKGWAGVQRDTDTVKESATRVSATVKALLSSGSWRHLDSGPADE